MASVEAFGNSRKVKGRTAGKAFRQHWQPTSACSVNPDDMVSFVTVIAAAIAETKRARGCGTYLFIDPELNAYLIPEERPAALEWVKTKLTWMVGAYEQKAKGPTLELDRLGEDVAEHLKELGVMA